MKSERTLLIATGNMHKRDEFAAMLGPDWQILTLRDFPELPPIEETGSTFLENSAIKALALSHLAPEHLVLADDSGLSVAALEGAPGVYSARYAGADASDSDNREKLKSELSARGLTSSEAAFQCALTLAWDGSVIAQFEGAAAGRIHVRESGSHGFGYDSMFTPDGGTQSFAEIPAEEKNAVSHRAVAMKKLASYLGADR